MTFALKTSKSFNNIELVELINQQHLGFLLKSKEIKKIPTAEKSINILGKMYKKIRNNRLQVKYTRKGDYGRYYASKTQSYQFMKKSVRNSLVDDKYVDIDMVNSHYSILYSVCKKLNKKCPNIKKYVKEREEMIKLYRHKFNLTKRKCKDMFIMILYFSNYKKATSQEDDYLNDLTDEIKNITNQIIIDNPKLVKFVNKTKEESDNFNGSFLSFYLQSLENNVLSSMYKYLFDNNHIIDRVATLCFDGIMISKTKNTDDNLLRNIEKYITEETGYSIKLSYKDFDYKLIDFNKIKKKVTIDESKLKMLDIKYLIKLPSYESKKEYFDNFVKKVLNPECCYVVFDKKRNKINVRKKEDIADMVSNVKSGIFNKSGEETAFFVEWSNDINNIPKNNYDFSPINPDEEHIEDEDVVNLFTGYDKRINTKYNKKKRAKIIKPYLDLLYEVVGGNKINYDYYLAFLSNMIKEPRNKPAICIIIRSEQGVGKNVSNIPIRNIIGEAHYISSSEPKDFFDTHAEGYFRKLFVNLDEIEMKKSFDIEGILKTRISEKTMVMNAKHRRPVEVANHSRTVAFTNKGNPLKIDIRSGDRRFVVYLSTEKYLTRSADFWSKLVKYFEKPKFISALYDFFMEYDYSNINWIKDRPLTNEYKEMIKMFIPTEALFMTEYLIELKDREIDDRENYETEISHLYGEYLRFIDDNNLGYEGKKPNIKYFMRNIKDIIRTGITVRDEDKMFILNLKEIKKALIFKRYIDVELDEYDLLNDDIEEDVIDDDYFDISDDEN